MPGPSFPGESLKHSMCHAHCAGFESLTYAGSQVYFNAHLMKLFLSSPILQTAPEWWNTHGLGYAAVYLCAVCPRHPQTKNVPVVLSLIWDWIHVTSLEIPFRNWFSAPVLLPCDGVCAGDVKALHADNGLPCEAIVTSVSPLLLVFYWNLGHRPEVLLPENHLACRAAVACIVSCLERPQQLFRYYVSTILPRPSAGLAAGTKVHSRSPSLCEGPDETSGRSCDLGPRGGPGVRR